MSSRRQRSIPLGGRYRQVSLHKITEFSTLKKIIGLPVRDRRPCAECRIRTHDLLRSPVPEKTWRNKCRCDKKSLSFSVRDVVAGVDNTIIRTYSSMAEYFGNFRGNDIGTPTPVTNYTLPRDALAESPTGQETWGSVRLNCTVSNHDWYGKRSLVSDRPYWYLTHWGRDKMDAISQTTFSNAFSWMKMCEFWLTFQWSLFLGVQLTIFEHWFR